MKKLIALAITVAILHNYGIAQVTTETEYNYIKEGLKTTELQGLDLKSGYYFMDTTTMEKNGLNVIVRTLGRSSNKSIAGISIRIIDKAGSTYLCMPATHTASAESFGWEQYLKIVNGFDWRYKETMFYVTSSLYGYYRSLYNRRSKN